MLYLTAVLGVAGLALCLAAAHRPSRTVHVVVDQDDDEGELHVRVYAGNRLLHAVTDPGPDVSSFRGPRTRLYVINSGLFDEHQGHGWAEQVATAARRAPRAVRAYLASRVLEYHQPVANECRPCLTALTEAAPLH